MIRNRSSPPAPSARTRHNFSIRSARRRLSRCHIQSRKVIQVLIRRLLRPLNRTPRATKIRKLRSRLIRFIPSIHGRSRQKISSDGCVRRPKTLNLRSNQGSATYTKFPNYPHPLSHLQGPAAVGSTAAGSVAVFGGSSTLGTAAGDEPPLDTVAAGATREPSAVSGGGATGPDSASGCVLFKASPPLFHHASPATQHTDSASPRTTHIQ
jgi:hypothetical protein